MILTTTALLWKLRQSPHALLLRELAPEWEDRVVVSTRSLLDDLRARGLVAFSPQTDRYRYIGPKILPDSTYTPAHFEYTSAAELDKQSTRLGRPPQKANNEREKTSSTLGELRVKFSGVKAPLGDEINGRVYQCLDAAPAQFINEFHVVDTHKRKGKKRVSHDGFRTPKPHKKRAPKFKAAR